MKFLNAIIFSILICNIFSALNITTDCTEEQYHIINYDTTDRILELDWTDDDAYTLNVNFYETPFSAGDKGIIGLFVNASVSKDVDGQTYESYVVNQKDTEGYSLFNIIEGDNYNSYKFSASITPSIVSANKEVITEKFYKYFGWYECSGTNSGQLRKSEILVIVNSGKLYQISKYLLFVMASLLI